MIPISVCILTKNNEATIKKTLDSVKEFEVILLDNGSEDNTLEIAKRYSNVVVHKTVNKGFGALRNEIVAHASNDWILALDSDEWISEKLLDELRILQLSPACVYDMPRNNFYNGRHIKGCGWHPDRVIRLYHKNQTRYQDDLVHESVITHGLTLKHLQGPLIHTPYRSTSDFLHKMELYTTLFAKQHQGKKSASFSKALFKALFTFFRSYILQRGFIDGKEGFEISLYNANVAFYKYQKLSEYNK
jgi:glycosyltransferase involved in cell wall biosynthesis